jgi:putative transposase
MRKGLSLTVVERAELVRRATTRSRPIEARRARIILLLGDGLTWAEIMERLGCSRALIARWCARFRDCRIAGLTPHHHGQGPRTMTEALERRILRAATQRRANGNLRWSTRGLGSHLGVSHMTIHRVWRDHGIVR